MSVASVTTTFTTLAISTEFGGGGDRSLARIEDRELDLRMARQQRAAPAPRPEGVDRRQRQQARAERQDRAVGREVVGGRAGRRRHHGAVAIELGHALVPSIATAMRAVWRLERSSDTSLIAVASCRSPRALVATMRNGVRVTCGHCGSAAAGRFPVGVQQEADSAEIHAENRRPAAHVAVERLQHQPVAAQRHHDVGLGRRNDAVALLQRALAARAAGWWRQRKQGGEWAGGGSHRAASAMLSVQVSYYSDAAPMR